MYAINIQAHLSVSCRVVGGYHLLRSYDLQLYKYIQVAIYQSTLGTAEHTASSANALAVCCMLPLFRISGCSWVQSAEFIANGSFSVWRRFCNISATVGVNYLTQRCTMINNPMKKYRGFIIHDTYCTANQNKKFC